MCMISPWTQQQAGYSSGCVGRQAPRQFSVCSGSLPTKRCNGTQLSLAVDVLTQPTVSSYTCKTQHNNCHSNYDLAGECQSHVQAG